MHICLETKIATLISLPTAAICCYLAPLESLTGLALGFFEGKRMGNANADHIRRNDNPLTAAYALSLGLPGPVTATLNACGCYALVNKVCLPIFLGIQTLPLLLFSGSFLLGFALGRYSSLNQLHLWSLTANRPEITNVLNGIVL